MDVYRKKQQWDAASLPDPVISPLRSYRQLLDPTTERWPVFPTFDQRTLAGLIQDELLRPRGTPGRNCRAPRGVCLRPLAGARRGYSAAVDHNRRRTVDPPAALGNCRGRYRPSETRLSCSHGGRRGMGEVLVRAFGYTVAARYLDNSEEMVRERYSHIEAGELGDVANRSTSEQID